MPSKTTIDPVRSATSQIGVAAKTGDPERIADAYRKLHVAHVMRATDNALHGEHALTAEQSEKLILDVALAVAVAVKHPHGCDCDESVPGDYCDACLYYSCLETATRNGRLSVGQIHSAVAAGVEVFDHVEQEAGR